MRHLGVWGKKALKCRGEGGRNPFRLTALRKELHVSHANSTALTTGLRAYQALRHIHSLRKTGAKQGRIYRAHHLANETDIEKIQNAGYLKMLNRGLCFPE